MIILISLFIVMYLIISYTSIYQFNMNILNCLRVMLGLLVVFFIYTAVMHVPGNIKYWITLLALCLWMNVEITAFKNKFNDKKAKMILDIFSIIIALMLIVIIAVSL
ncbi:membrane stabilizing protein MspA [Macrococcoides caseolyticum]|uniref:membrane stabilizing protein MspA n=1 Tax=Macrococcoides caseolyticum TaxID=69966 RepID=UPI001F1A9492|nr:membrane stabilizing protein MspA [Macrococcus caseolyticus]MCE4956444.1 membrane stabilizing protein MspA [Macrococcus caseolyticus]